LTIPTAFTSVKQSVSIAWKSNKVLAQADKVVLVLPSWTMDDTTTTTTATNCGTTTFTVGVANSGTATAAITFTAATADLAATGGGTACTITTDASQLTTAVAAQDANLAGRTMEIVATTDDNKYAATAIATSTATAVPAFSLTELTFDAPMKTSTPLSLKFTCAAPMQVGQTLTLTLPSWALTGTAAPTTQGCGTTTLTTAVADTGEATAAITFTVATADLAAATACTLTTATATATTPIVVQAANLNTRKLKRLAEADHAIIASSALGQPLYADSLHIAYPVVGTASVLTYTFKSAVVVASGSTIKLTLPSWTVAAGTPTKSGCGDTTFTAVSAAQATNTGEATAALLFTTGTAVLAIDTACTITIPSSMATSAAAAQAMNFATRTALATVASETGATVRKISTSTATVASAAFATNSALVVATTTGSTATSLALTFDSNIPLAIGDYVMLTLPDWGVSGTAAPTAVGCGTSTFTTVTGMSGTATAYVQFVVASALLDTVTYVGNDYLLGHNCTLTWASGAKTPATAQAANLNTRKIAAIIAAGADIANTTIATSTATTAAATPTPTPTSGGNSTSTCTYSSASTCATRVTQSVVVSSLTAANYIGNLKSIYECGYAQAVRSDFCTSTSGATTIKTGVQVTSTAAARRAATITFVMDVETGVMATAALQTAILDGVTPAALVNKMTVIRTSTGWSTLVLPSVADLTVNTAAFTGAATSSAAVVIPSALMVLLGSFISLFWN